MTGTYDSFEEFNADVIAAREEYEAHPIAAIEEDWCQKCCWPREQQRCTVCTAHMAMRRLRAAK